MVAYQFPVKALLEFNGNKVTDHNRAQISVGTEKFGNDNRMVNATLRRYVVSEKRTWSVGWNNLFAKSGAVVDGYWSGEEIRSFYKATPGEFTLTLNYGDGTKEYVLVMFTSWSYDVLKRTPGQTGDWWDVSLEMTEV